MSGGARQQFPYFNAMDTLRRHVRPDVRIQGIQFAEALGIEPVQLHRLAFALGTAASNKEES